MSIVAERDKDAVRPQINPELDRRAITRPHR
jgi:hypothetical protein